MLEDSSLANFVYLGDVPHRVWATVRDCCSHFDVIGVDIVMNIETLELRNLFQRENVYRLKCKNFGSYLPATCILYRSVGIKLSCN